MEEESNTCCEDIFEIALVGVNTRQEQQLLIQRHQPCMEFLQSFTIDAKNLLLYGMPICLF